ncbi:MAG: YkgJ family cysteine cluster protein [Methanomassiliicoccaceae archaeon]|nr:YkgJ family cysteine cluster protein [Methanomassiliicoccaceae archaeon]
MNDPVIDYSELIGRKVYCPPECGMCCLCQPEILPDEYSFFKTKHPSSITKKKEPHEHFAVALKKGRGSCVFLDDDRRCSIYANRPTYCRQFPFHFHVSDRIRVELDLSCRGVWYGKGNDAVSEAEALAQRSAYRLKTALMEATGVYREFFGLCKEAGVFAEQSTLRSSVHENISNFTDLAYLAEVMNASLDEPSVSLSEITPNANFDMDELNEAAREAALSSMQSFDPFSVPVYCDGQWNWNLFMAGKNGIDWSVLDNNGDLHVKGSADPGDIVLPQMDGGAKKVLRDYINILNRRDSMMGYAYHTMDSLNYEDDMTNVYYGSLAVSIIDLMWRSAMLDRLMGIGGGENGMREAIIFYDMDRLDAPTIGAFV